MKRKKKKGVTKTNRQVQEHTQQPPHTLLQVGQFGTQTSPPGRVRVTGWEPLATGNMPDKKSRAISPPSSVHSKGGNWLKRWLFAVLWANTILVHPLRLSWGLFVLLYENWRRKETLLLLFPKTFNVDVTILSENLLEVNKRLCITERALLASKFQCLCFAWTHFHSLGKYFLM